MKKESLSIIFVKTLLAVLLFAGMGTIIIGGGYIVWEYSKMQNSNKIIKKLPDKWKVCNQDSDCVGTRLDCTCYIKDAINEVYLNDWTNILQERCGNNCMMHHAISYRRTKNEAICENSECKIIEEEYCAKAGELINDYPGVNKNLLDVCCEGLEGLAGFGINESGECEQLEGGPFLTCMPCENGVCDTINNFDENKCNCPEDCGDNILVSCCDLECGQYKYSNCPEGCAKSCIGSCPACADCEGEGSCYCQDDCDELKIINTSDWQTYRNEEFGFEVKFQDNDKIVIGGNPNYFCLKKKDINDFYRCYIYINFLHILDEEYHESYKGITYDNLEQYIEYLYSVKRKGYNENDYIVKMERVKNNEGTDILEVIIGDEATDYSRKEYYIEYDDAIYGNYKNEKDYLTISRGATYLLNADEKEQQSEQFEQVLSTFKFIEKDDTSDWQTYRNEEFGFEVEYPEDWFVYERSDQKRVYIQTTEGHVSKATMQSDFKRIWIGYAFDKLGERDEDYLKKYPGIKKYDMKNGEILMNIYEYEDIDMGEIMISAYWTKDNNNYLAQSASEVGQKNAKEQAVILKQILSTFKFIEK